MYNWKTAAELSAKYWESVATDNSSNINGFNGTFNITDHDLIPTALLDYISEKFYGFTRLSRIPLEDINEALNEVWEGPGSMAKVVRTTYDLREIRKNNQNVDDDPLKGYDTPTVDSELTASVDIEKD
jgi:hypothetical protein